MRRRLLVFLCLALLAFAPAADAKKAPSWAQADIKDSAYRFYRAASAAGLKPPSRFGTEVVARLLGLRFNHPDGTDDLELGPNDPATRAEAAYTFARVLELDEWHVQWIKNSALAFQLPAYT